MESSLRRVTSLSLGLLLFFSSGFTFSQSGPFFPIEAQKKGVSTFLIGATISSLDVFSLLTCLILPLFLKPKHHKFAYCTGSFVVGVMVILFGVSSCLFEGTAFFLACMMSRVVMGIGSASLFSTGISVLTPIYPNWMGRIASLIDLFLGLGFFTGSSFGSLLYSYGGYPFPFVIAGCVQIFFTILCIPGLPKSTPSSATNYTNENEPHYEPEERSFFHFITRPSLIVISIPFIFAIASFPYVNVALSPHLNSVYGVESEKMSYYFLFFNGLFTLGSPLVGLVADKGYANFIYLFGCFLCSTSFLLLALPGNFPYLENQYLLVYSLASLGLFCSFVTVCAYILLETVAILCGFHNEKQVKLMLGSWVNFIWAVAGVAGPTMVGGLFMEHFGFYKSSLLFAFIIFSSSCAMVFELKRIGLLKKLDGNSFSTTQTILSTVDPVEEITVSKKEEDC